MSDNKMSKEELKKIEDEAYFELCQIIAEAMQLQDIDLLDARISVWKSKYKKLLDGSASSSNFRKRIEFLLNQYYSEVTQYILRQIKFKEEKKIENQSKALRKLYKIIKETNDLSLLKKKVKEWESEYPISAFLDMYKKKIELAVTNKNLERNAFDQEQAFYDLQQITKINGTFDELKAALSDWEKEYSINDKYTIDDFIKNQSEVKRYTSDEYLQSISRQESKANEEQITNSYNDTTSISKQAEAYNSLLAIANKPNNINQIFNWVYKYHSIKFNDRYKELILAATYLDYSPTYLNSMKIPDIDLSKSALSRDEYNNMPEILRYTVISYFNLLLSPDKAVSNNYFNKHIREIYYSSEILKHSNIPNTSIDEIISSGIEIPLVNKTSNLAPDGPERPTASSFSSKQNAIDETEIQFEQTIMDKSTTSEVNPEQPIIEEATISEAEAKQPALEEVTISEAGAQQPIIEEVTISEAEAQQPIIEDISTPKDKNEQTTISYTEPEGSTLDKISASTVKDNQTTSENVTSTNIGPEQTIAHTPVSVTTLDNYSPNTHTYTETEDNHENNSKQADESMDHNTIVTLSPKFFEVINYYNTQAELINVANQSAIKHTTMPSKSQTITKTRNQS